MAQSGHCAVVCRLRDRRVPETRRTRQALGDPQRALGGSGGGYLHGVLAPGHRNLYEAPIATHNLLRAHGAAVQAYRATGRHRIGLVVNIEPKYTATPAEEDRAATARADAYMNRQYLDPVFLGSYPEKLREIFSDAWPNC